MLETNVWFWFFGVRVFNLIAISSKLNFSCIGQNWSRRITIIVIIISKARVKIYWCKKYLLNLLNGLFGQWVKGLGEKNYIRWEQVFWPNMWVEKGRLNIWSIENLYESQYKKIKAYAFISLLILFIYVAKYFKRCTFHYWRFNEKWKVVCENVKGLAVSQSRSLKALFYSSLLGFGGTLII